MRTFCVCMKNAEKIQPFKIFLWLILKDQTFSALMQVKKFLTNRVCQECFLSAEFAYFRRSSPSYKRSLGRKETVWYQLLVCLDPAGVLLSIPSSQIFAVVWKCVRPCDLPLPNGIYRDLKRHRGGDEEVRGLH